MQTCESNEKPETAVRLTVDEFELAEALGVSVFFLRNDRRNKKTIPFYRLGSRVVYNLDRVLASLVATEEGGSPKLKRLAR